MESSLGAEVHSQRSKVTLILFLRLFIRFCRGYRSSGPGWSVKPSSCAVTFQTTIAVFFFILLVLLSCVFTPLRWRLRLTSACPEPVVCSNTWPLSDEAPVHTGSYDSRSTNNTEILQISSDERARGTAPRPQPTGNCRLSRGNKKQSDKCRISCF